jgi:hypothetical protein
MIKTVRAGVEAIDEDAWQQIEYPDDGEAQIAETVSAGRRLIVRRTRLLGAQAELWPNWRHFCLITNRTEGLTIVEAEHREHAVVEQVIADLKDQGLAHPGTFTPMGAWTVLAALAHNLLRWTQLLGLSAGSQPPPDRTPHSPRQTTRSIPPTPARAPLAREQPGRLAPTRHQATATDNHSYPDHSRTTKQPLSRPPPISARPSRPIDGSGLSHGPSCDRGLGTS